MNFSIDEDVMRQFCDSDVIVSPSYHAAKSNQFTCANMFFNAIEDDEEVPDTRPLIARIMKDAVLVRILEVSLYATVPSSFWDGITKQWMIENAVGIRRSRRT